MGALLSYFYGSSVNEAIDPETGLTESQRKLVQNCWKFLQPDICDIGVEIMITLFKKYPEYQDAFPKFRDRELEELTKDRTFHAHCLGIMGTFEQAIEYLHDAELCVAGLHMTGERHGRRGQDTRPFEVLKPLTCEILKSRLGSRCTEAMSEAIDIGFSLFFREIIHGINEYNESKKKKSRSDL